MCGAGLACWRRSSSAEGAAGAEVMASALKAAMAARDAGVITRAIAGGGLQVSPPLVITRDQLDELATGLRAGLDAI